MSMDHDKMKAALLIGLKPKGEEGEEGGGGLKECLAAMYDAIHAGDKEKFVSEGMKCLGGEAEEPMPEGDEEDE